MKLIAFETSAPASSLAAAQSIDGVWRVQRSVDLPQDLRTAQSLAPALADLLAELSWRASDLDAVAAVTGPGSFTGLRIGVTAAKTLAYAADAQAVGLNTLAVIARQWFAYPQCDHAPRTHVVIDAHRKEFFNAVFEYPPSGGKPTPDVRIISRNDWIDELKSPGSQPRSGSDAVSGPGLALIRDQLPEGMVVAPESDWRPRAETVALMAGEALDAGAGIEPWKLVPEYYRLSAAEEKAEAKTGSAPDTAGG